MPQLDTVYIFMTYMWTWYMLYLLIKKTKTLLIIKTPKTIQPTKNQKPMLMLPWM